MASEGAGLGLRGFGQVTTYRLCPWCVLWGHSQRWACVSLHDKSLAILVWFTEVTTGKTRGTFPLLLSPAPNTSLCQCDRRAYATHQHRPDSESHRKGISSLSPLHVNSPSICTKKSMYRKLYLDYFINHTTSLSPWWKAFLTVRE